MAPEDSSTGQRVAVDWTSVLHSLLRLPGALTVAVGMPPFSVSLLLFPTLFSLAVAPAHPDYEEQTSGAIGMARWAQGKPPEVMCP